LFIKKGFVTEEEARRIKAEADALRASPSTNALPATPESSWKLNKVFKNLELYGDLRLRYEQREAKGPVGERIELDRGRFSARIGLRGEVLDDFYFGFRLDTGSNPRSPWITFGTSSSGVPYFGPYGKSSSGIAIGEVYLGWHPTSWVDVTLGKMRSTLLT